eukprot:1614525-Rhodomonas_salina.1
MGLVGASSVQGGKAQTLNPVPCSVGSEPTNARPGTAPIAADARPRESPSPTTTRAIFPFRQVPTEQLRFSRT